MCSAFSVVAGSHEKMILLQWMFATEQETSNWEKTVVMDADSGTPQRFLFTTAFLLLSMLVL